MFYNIICRYYWDIIIGILYPNMFIYFQFFITNFYKTNFIEHILFSPQNVIEHFILTFKFDWTHCILCPKCYWTFHSHIHIWLNTLYSLPKMLLNISFGCHLIHLILSPIFHWTFILYLKISLDMFNPNHTICSNPPLWFVVDEGLNKWRGWEPPI